MTRLADLVWEDGWDVVASPRPTVPCAAASGRSTPVRPASNSSTAEGDWSPPYPVTAAPHGQRPGAARGKDHFGVTVTVDLNESRRPRTGRSVHRPRSTRPSHHRPGSSLRPACRFGTSRPRTGGSLLIASDLTSGRHQHRDCSSVPSTRGPRSQRLSWSLSSLARRYRQVTRAMRGPVTSRGGPLTTISREVGTSVQMIEQHYAGVIENWDGQRIPAEDQIRTARERPILQSTG